MRQVPITEGTWAKVGDKRYRHIDGAEVFYDYNHFVWRIVGQPGGWRTLSAAQHEAER